MNNSSDDINTGSQSLVNAVEEERREETPTNPKEEERSSWRQISNEDDGRSSAGGQQTGLATGSNSSTAPSAPASNTQVPLVSATATVTEQLAYLLLQQQQQQQQQQQNQEALGAAAAVAAAAMIPLSATSAATLHGTPGYPPAVIPYQQLIQQQQLPAALPVETASVAMVPQNCFLTVQDRPMEQPVYNGVNPAYPGLRVLRTQPPLFCVDDFLTDLECDFLIQHAHDSFGPAPVVGKGAGEVSPSRTSSTCYLAREDLPDILRKVHLLTGKPIEHCELPQVGRYLQTQQYLQHYDAFDLSTEDGQRFASNGGQRTITVLIYLNTVAQGGATRFPSLNLDVQPKKGMALVFFPATVGGLLDKMALHAALPAVETKYVSQIWIRQGPYAGQPSKRLPQTLGMPFGQETVQQPPPPPQPDHLMQQPQWQPPEQQAIHHGLPQPQPQQHEQPATHHNQHGQQQHIQQQPPPPPPLVAQSLNNPFLQQQQAQQQQHQAPLSMTAANQF